MSATHNHLTDRHHALLASRAEQERIGGELARMRQLLAELPGLIASAEEYEGVLSRHVEQERALLAEEAKRTRWQPPAPVQAGGEQPIEHAARMARGTQGLPVVQPVQPVAEPCPKCGEEEHREGISGTRVHSRTGLTKCDPAKVAAHSEQDGSADL